MSSQNPVQSRSVLIVGNQSNAGFRLGRLLRARGWQVELAFVQRDGDPRSLPEQLEPAIGTDGDPAWVHRYMADRFVPHRLTRLRTKIGLWRDPLSDWIVDGMRDAIAQRTTEVDAFVAFGREVDYCAGLGRPVVMYPVGSPVTEDPFKHDDPVALRRRRSLAAIDALITPSQQVYWLGRTLGIRRIVEGSYPVDPSEVRSLADAKFKREFERQRGDCDLVYFLPSRKNLEPSAPDYKGNEKVLYAFDEYLQQATKRVRLVCNLHGRHRDAFQNLLAERSYGSDVLTFGHMSRPELFGALASSQLVVFDQFSGGAQTVLAGTARESVMSGAVTVSEIDKSSRYFRRTYDAHCPVLEAHDVGELVDVMRKLDAMPAEHFEKLRDDTRAWAERMTDKHVAVLGHEIERCLADGPRSTDIS